MPGLPMPMMGGMGVRPPMPGMGGAPGGGPPGGTGATMTPQPMMGSLNQGMTGVKVGLDALQKALPMLPMGSELWSSVHKALGDIGKHMDQMGGGNPSAIIQQLTAMARDAQTGPQRSALMSMSPGGGPPPSGGGATPPPALPPPGGGP